MAISLEIGVSHLFPEFLANALVFLGSLQTAGAVTTGALQAFLDHLDHFLVIVQTYSHGVHILSDPLYDRGEECQGWMSGSLGKKKKRHAEARLFLVGEAGLEPARPQ